MIKPYEELTFTDDFMFCKVMTSRPDLCEELVSLAIGHKVRIAGAGKQVSIDETSDGRGVRLDVVAVDGDGAVYDVEMQAVDKGDLPQRARYYQGMLDLAALDKGALFEDLRRSFVIFICPFDAFGRGLHYYSYRQRCDQDGEPLGDGAAKLFLCAAGDADDVSPEMRAFLDYVGGIMSDDPFVGRLEEAVEAARLQSKWKDDYMFHEVKLMEARHEGFEAGVEQGLETGRAEGMESILAKLRAQGVDEALLAEATAAVLAESRAS